MIGSLLTPSRLDRVLRLLDEERKVLLGGPLSELPGLVARREALVAELEALFATRDAAYWMELLGRAGVPCAPINSVGQALEHPVARARGMRITLGGVPLLGSPLHLAATPVRYELPPPRLGEHTDAILAELGEDTAALRAAGVVA